MDADFKRKTIIFDNDLSTKLNKIADCGNTLDNGVDSFLQHSIYKIMSLFWECTHSKVGGSFMEEDKSCNYVRHVHNKTRPLFRRAKDVDVTVP